MNKNLHLMLYLFQVTTLSPLSKDIKAVFLEQTFPELFQFKLRSLLLGHTVYYLGKEHGQLTCSVQKSRVLREYWS